MDPTSKRAWMERSAPKGFNMCLTSLFSSPLILRCRDSTLQEGLRSERVATKTLESMDWLSCCLRKDHKFDNSYLVPKRVKLNKDAQSLGTILGAHGKDW